MSSRRSPRRISLRMKLLVAGTATIVPMALGVPLQMTGATGSSSSPTKTASTPTATDLPPYGLIDNGVVQLGVNPEGDLNVFPNPQEPSARGTIPVGLRYMPTNDD